MQTRDSWPSQPSAIAGKAAIAVLTCTFIIPFILGGNRPLAWPIATIILAPPTLLVAVGVLSGRERRLTIEVSSLLLIYCVLLVYVIAQCLPLGKYLPDRWIALPAGVSAGTAISLSPQDTLLALLRWINIGLLAFLIFHISISKSRSERFFFLLFCVGLIHASYGLLLRYQFGDTILFAPKWAYVGSTTGAFVNRNSFATFLSVAAVLSVTLLLQRLKELPLRSLGDLLRHLSITRGFLLPALGAAIILTTLISTNSRLGGFAGLAGVLVTAILMTGDRATRRGVVIAALAVLCCFAVALVLFGDILMQRVEVLQDSAEVRTDLYRQVITMISARPFTGYGGGTFEVAFPLFHQLPVNPDYLWDHAHSSYLGLWADYGLIFGSLPLLLLLIIFFRLIIAFARESTADPLIISGISATVAVAIHAIGDFSLEIHGVTLYYTAVVALAFGRLMNKSQKPAGRSFQD